MGLSTQELQFLSILLLPINSIGNSITHNVYTEKFSYLAVNGLLRLLTWLYTEQTLYNTDVLVML